MQAQVNNTTKAQRGKRARGEVRQQPAETKRRYLQQLFRLQATARRIQNSRVVIALQSLINRVALRGLGVN